MANNKFIPIKAIKITRTIYFGMIVTSFLYLAVVIYIRSGNYFFKADLSDPLLITLPLLFIFSITLGFFISRKTLREIQPSDTLAKKYPVYQSALIIRMASCEGIALFSVVCLLLTNNLYCLLFYFAALALMIRYYPSPEKISGEISLTPSETESFYR